MRSPVWAPRRRASASIWTTSSRVGAMISTRGAVGPLLAGAGCRRQRVKAAIRKAAVLPVPVWDWPATSLPLRASGSVPSWIGVMATKPASWTPRMTGSGRSSDLKSMGLMAWPGGSWRGRRLRGRLRPRRLALPHGQARADDADLVEDAEGARHQGLVDHVGRWSEHGGNDEVDQDGVLAILGEELRRHDADQAQDRDHHRQLEDETEGQRELDHEVRVGGYRDHRLPALLLPEGHEEVRGVGDDHEHREGAADQEERRSRDDERRGVFVLMRVEPGR